MSHELPIPVQLRSLFDVVCDEMATEEQLRELESALRDEATRELYWEYCRLHVDLHFAVHQQQRQDLVREKIRAEASLVPELSPVPGPSFLGNAIHTTAGYFSSSWPVAYLVATVIVGVGLLIGTLVHVSQPKQIATQPTLPSPSGRGAGGEGSGSGDSSFPLIVGQITGIVDCKWENKVDKLAQSHQGARISLGDRFALTSGLMEITYDTGAKVILQGPCTYEVDSKSSGFLSIGKLTARVEKKATNLPSPSGRGAGGEGGGNGIHPSSFILHPLFSVRTPIAIVTDLGTEFGVEVDKSGFTAAHVFRGVVEVTTAPGNGKQGQAIRLNENESAKVEQQRGGEGLAVHRGAADASAFVRSEQLPKSAQELRLEPFRRWQAYSQDLRRDPSLLAYYDFQRASGESTVLPNVAANGDSSLDGKIEGAKWSDGRMVEKQALQFNGPADYVRINLPQKVDNLTLATWVYVEIYDHDLSGLLMSDLWNQKGQVHWQLLSDDRMGFDIHDGCNVQQDAIVSERVRLHRWMHLATVHDHGAARTRFYINGHMSDEVTTPTHVPICIGSARIGNWDPGEWDTPDHNESAQLRNFRGRMDELAIFGRPLPSDEIQRMFEAGKPPDVHNLAGRSNRR